MDMETDNNKLEAQHKSLSTQLIAKQQEILNFSRDILSGKESLTVLEMQSSIEVCLSKPVIKSIFKTQEQVQLAFGVVGVIVQRFFDSLGFSTKISPVQIDVITADTLENFKYESLEDIVLFFKYCRQGKFGSTHRGVDSNLLFGEWFPKYMELKATERESLKEQEKKEHIKSDKENIVYNYYKKIAYDKYLKEQNKKIQIEIDDMVKSMDKQMLEDTISDWSNKPELSEHLKYLKTKRSLFR